MLPIVPVSYYPDFGSKKLLPQAARHPLCYPLIRARSFFMDIRISAISPVGKTLCTSRTWTALDRSSSDLLG